MNGISLTKDQFFSQSTNAFLRLLPLVAKFILTIYMGHFFTLEEMGVYGLVFSAAMISNVLLGQRFDYVVARDVVTAPPLLAARKMRDEAFLYSLNYALLGIASLVVYLFDMTVISGWIIFFTFLLSVLEGYANILYLNMNALGRQLAANVTFFVRAGVWVVPAIALGLWDPSFNTAGVVLGCWSAGAAASLVVGMWFLREFPWLETLRLPIDWVWIIHGLRKTIFVWLGSIGIACGVYTDRFIVAHYIDIDAAGVATFFFSLSSALYSVMQSGVLAFSMPRLVQFHSDGDVESFKKEARSSFWQVIIGATTLAISLGVAVFFFGFLFGNPAFVKESPTLWLLLFGSWLRVLSSIYLNVLFARHQDRAVWLGDMLFLIPALGGNMLFVPFFGLIGIGMGSVAAGFFLVFWRKRCAEKIFF